MLVTALQKAKINPNTLHTKDVEKAFVATVIVAEKVNVKRTFQVAKNNAWKNRYTNVFPYDDVALIPYFNASWVEVRGKRFLMAQGPTWQTIHDHTDAIEQYEIPLVVTLGPSFEEKEKYVEWWPKNHPKKKIAKGIFYREKIPLQKGYVNQLDFPGWKDYGTSDLKPLKFLIAEVEKVKGPVMVHCSAGLGRTGTFVAMYGLKGQKPTMLNACEMMLKLRSARAGSIQTAPQFGMVVSFLKKGSSLVSNVD